MKIFLIEKIWTDSMENEIDSAVGYDSWGYMTNEKNAKEFCEKGKTFTQNDCWAIRENMPEYRYRKILKVRPIKK